jgi:CNT family concentrative nucleoside transporter
MTDTTAADRSVRLVAIGAAASLALLAFLLRYTIVPSARGALGIACFIAVVVAFSSRPALINWRTVSMGIGLQLLLALFILKLEIGGWRPGYEAFAWLSGVVKQFLEFTNAGSQFVFGDLANPAVMGNVIPNGFVFAFVGLPTIIFVSAFFTVLYYYGILQFIVRLMAGAMMRLMGTSGAETLSAAAPSPSTPTAPRIISL